MTCAAGKANLQSLIDDGLITNSKKLEKYSINLNDISKKYKSNIDIQINGQGLVAGVIFKDHSGKPLNSLCKKICWDCLLNGLIVVFTGRESIKLAPPLSIHLSALKEGLSVFEDLSENISNTNL